MESKEKFLGPKYEVSRLPLENETVSEMPALHDLETTGPLGEVTTELLDKILEKVKRERLVDGI